MTRHHDGRNVKDVREEKGQLGREEQQDGCRPRKGEAERRSTVGTGSVRAETSVESGTPVFEPDRC